MESMPCQKRGVVPQKSAEVNLSQARLADHKYHNRQRPEVSLGEQLQKPCHALVLNLYLVASAARSTSASSHQVHPGCAKVFGSADVDSDFGLGGVVSDFCPGGD